MTLLKRFLRVAQDFPARRCFKDGSCGTWITYDAMLQKTSTIFRLLTKECKVGPSDRVVLVGANSSVWAASMLATLASGAAVAPVSPRNFTSDTVRALQPRVVIDLTNTGTKVPVPVPVITESTISEYHNHQGVINIDVNSNQPAFVLSTSGTGGTPSQITLTHRNILSNLTSIDQRLAGSIGPEDTSVSFLPWNHCYGLTCELLYMTSKGASVFINQDLRVLMRDLWREEPSVLFGVPRLYYRAHDFLQRVPPFLRPMAKRFFFGGKLTKASTGGAGISEDVIRFYRDSLGIDLCQGYGMTEASPMVALNVPWDNRIGSVGRVLDGVEVRIDHAKEKEILVRGDSVIQEDWYRTGDTGYLDKDGYLFVTGRLSESYKLDNGRFINPARIENEILKSPLISQAYVWGLDRPYNVCLLRTSLTSSTEALREVARVCNKTLHPYEMPRRALLMQEDDFSVENGMMTPKMSLRRQTIHSKYGAALQRLY
jgi:long-chain acyl-CoA synthetase